ncbi:phage regulatory, Rha family protein [Shigella sonnei 3226-85]|nr:hypothetical protein Sd1012_0009 [Shigella dysenteriae 1012]EIQ42220.1 phage regulatory, Rha family protein [Shigella sonnei 3226-85]
MSNSPKPFLMAHWSVPWRLSGFIWKNRDGLLLTGAQLKI